MLSHSVSPPQPQAPRDRAVPSSPHAPRLPRRVPCTPPPLSSPSALPGRCSSLGSPQRTGEGYTPPDSGTRRRHVPAVADTPLQPRSYPLRRSPGRRSPPCPARPPGQRSAPRPCAASLRTVPLHPLPLSPGSPLRAPIRGPPRWRMLWEARAPWLDGAGSTRS